MKHNETQPELQVQNRVSARKRLDAQDERDRLRQTFTTPSVPIGTKPTAEAKKLAAKLFNQLNLQGYKLGAKRIFFARLIETAMRAKKVDGCVRYSRSTQSGKLLLGVVDAAVKAGFFEETRGKKGGCHMTRLIATEKLAENFEFEEEYLVKKLVIVRDRDGNEVDDGRDYSHIEAKIRRINRINAGCLVECRIEDAWGVITRRILNTDHHAVFHTGGRHGRLYASKEGWQNLTKFERSTITFDGEPSVELDYQAFHLRMAYHLNGEDFIGDPYKLWGERTNPALRKISKLVINTMMNSKTKSSAVAACNQVLRLRNLDGTTKTGRALQIATEFAAAMKKAKKSFKEVADLAERKHPIIRKVSGEKLMTLDAKMALNILYDFAQDSIPILGVHDSFIVPVRRKNRLLETMNRNYENRLGFLPIIS